MGEGRDIGDIGTTSATSAEGHHDIGDIGPIPIGVLRPMLPMSSVSVGRCRQCSRCRGDIGDNGAISAPMSRGMPMSPMSCGTTPYVGDIGATSAYQYESTLAVAHRDPAHAPYVRRYHPFHMLLTCLMPALTHPLGMSHFAPAACDMTDMPFTHWLGTPLTRAGLHPGWPEYRASAVVPVMTTATTAE
jgi:hypothetical protein